jgi:hypothetical protein
MLSNALIIGSGCFLLAVLWMDLMFDVQVLSYRHQRELPEEVLRSIAGYYQRVTTTARPMPYAVAVAMLIGVVSVALQLVRGDVPRSLSGLSLALIAPPVLLAGWRVLPNAVRLGAGGDPPDEQTRLARSICHDHLVCLVVILTLLALRFWMLATAGV